VATIRTGVGTLVVVRAGYCVLTVLVGFALVDISCIAVRLRIVAWLTVGLRHKASSLICY
jgi:hypothetical protein